MDRSPHTWTTSETLDRATAMAEFLMLGLRRLQGFDEDHFAVTFAVGIDEAAPALAALVESGFLSRENGRIALTREGLMLADSVTARLADFDRGR
jgi:coproporphyrinogen III oxidase-like Fe-S oxidoreductase